MTAATYLRHAISYVSEDHDQLRATALLYVPAAARDVRVTFPTTARGEDTPAFPTILSLHPTSSAAFSPFEVPPRAVWMRILSQHISHRSYA